MPGVKDRKRRRLVLLGRIRLGHKETRTRQNGSTYEVPVQDDHFLLHDAPDIGSFYYDEQGDEIRKIDVILPYPDIDRNFQTSYQLWAGGVLICEGNGECIDRAEGFIAKQDGKKMRVRNAPGGTRIANGVAVQDFAWGKEHFQRGDMNIPCSGKSQDLYDHCKLCNLSCTLRVMMSDPRLFRYGYYEIHTGGNRNYETILGTLETFPNSDLRGIPFTLRMVKGMTSYEDKDGQRHQKEMSFIELEPEKQMTRELYSGHIMQKLGRGPVEQQIPALPESVEPSPEEEPFGQVPPSPEEPEVQSNPIVIPEMPAELAGTNPTKQHFLTPAQKALGFKNIGTIMTAMLSIYGPEWGKKDIDPQDAWEKLCAYEAVQ